IERALSCEPSQVSWLDIDAIARTDPQKALARWDEIKEAARGEVRAGHRAARALEGYDSDCWRRARFLAVRAELTEAWRPRNADGRATARHARNPRKTEPFGGFPGVCGGV